jgi:SAM-dependent methyltransferase
VLISVPMQSLSFDDLTELYDETRSFDVQCFNLALDYISTRFPPQVYGKLFEPGIGTGRIAEPLTQKGYQVVGVDISERMLTHLRQSLGQLGHLQSVNVQRADVTSLPYADSAFDIAVVVHLFYFIREWRKAVREILRVVRDGHPIVLMHTGMGKEVPFLNDRYRELCAKQGYLAPTIGVKSTREVLKYLKQLGCRMESIRDRWRWVSQIRLDVATEYIRSRAYSFTTSTPEKIHRKAVAELEVGLEAEFGDLSTEIKVPNQIYLIVVSVRAYSA